MNHITRFKRHTRIMWFIVVFIWIAILSYLGNLASLPAIEPEVCLTEACVRCVDACTNETTEGGK